MGRRIRLRLPDFSGDRLVYVRKHKQSDEGGYLLEPLSRGDTMSVQRDGCWGTKATVQGATAPNPCQLITEDGRELRRNRQHLLRTSEDFAVARPVPEEDVSVGLDPTPTGTTLQRESNITTSAPAGEGADLTTPTDPMIYKAEALPGLTDVHLT